MPKKCLVYYGYSRVVDEDHIYYNHYDFNLVIVFDLIVQDVKFIHDDTDLAFAVNRDELSAVFEQVMELGW